MQKRFAIFTALVGNYDTISQPLVIDERFDYILFSDCISESNIGIWQVRKFNYKNDIPIKMARWVKTHPEELLADYECSLWMDANLDILTSFIYNRVIQLFTDNIKMASVVHPTRKCIYDEMIAVMELGYENEKMIINWGSHIHKEGYPQNAGLFETNLLYRRHHCEEINAFDQLWWSIIEQYSRRDQFSCNYAIWKLGLDTTTIFPAGISTSNSTDVCRRSHTNTGQNNKVQGMKRSYIMGAYLTGLINYNEIRAIYFTIYSSHYPFVIAFFYNLFYCLRLHSQKIIRA